jgi:hypothetical protein
MIFSNSSSVIGLESGNGLTERLENLGLLSSPEVSW